MSTPSREELVERVSRALFRMDAPYGDAALDRLRRFKMFHANWDAEGAPAPDSKSIDAASEILSLLAAKGHSPKVLLNTDSAPVLLFKVRGIECEVTINRKDSIDYFFNTDEGTGEADVQFDGKPPYTRAEFDETWAQFQRDKAEHQRKAKLQ